MPMNYFAVKAEEYSAVQRTLAQREMVSILYVLPSQAQWSQLPDKRKWVVVAYPPPWSESALNIAYQTIELASDGDDWRFRIVDRVKPMLAEFKPPAELVSGESRPTIVPEFDAESRQFLEDFFNTRWSELEAVMQPGKISDFCNLTGIPYVADLDQNAFGQGSPEYAYCQANGFACYAADVFGGNG